jgi:hypothetical protein
MEAFDPMPSLPGVTSDMFSAPARFPFQPRVPGPSHPWMPVVEKAPPVTPAQFEHREVASADVQKETKCSICLEQFAKGEKVCELPCKHIFHDACVRKWLQQKASCPVCRMPLAPKPSLPGMNTDTDELSWIEPFFSVF